MKRRPLNNVVLVVATQRRFRRASDDETTIRVVAFIINKWRAKISGKQLYNVRDPPKIGGSEKSKREREEYCSKLFLRLVQHKYQSSDFSRGLVFFIVPCIFLLLQLC